MSDTHRLLLLSIASPQPFSYDRLHTILDGANDWFRYSPTNFLVWTNETSQVWSLRLRGPGGLQDHSFVIFTVDPYDRNGWMPQQLWDWLNKLTPHRKVISGIARVPDRNQKHTPTGIHEIGIFDKKEK